MALKGISFPFRKADGEFPKRDTDEEQIRSNIIALFNLTNRSRVMRPEIGSRMLNFVFESIDPLLFSRMERSIRTTIAEGEPRATVEAVNFTSSGTKVIADIFYSVNGVQQVVQIERDGGSGV